MKKINPRQQKILKIIRHNPGIQNSGITPLLVKESGEEVTRVTIVRDLDVLLKAKLIKKIGRGRNVGYTEFLLNKLLTYFDQEEYFHQGQDERQLTYKQFNFGIFKDLKNFFSEVELKELTKINDGYCKRIKMMSPVAIQKEIERLTIELSWKSSQIEGNTYSLIDTEILIKENKEASGHKKAEAVMILNHKEALDYIFSGKIKFKKLTISKIEEIHSLLIKDLGVIKGLRKRPVGIVGTNFKPLDNQHQIREAIEKAVATINKSKQPLEKALLANLFIAYIQPFEDGNKRTSRLLANALLFANDFCPLSFRSIDEAEYKKAVILFYEQNSARYFKELLIEQFKFSVDNYFR